MCENLYGGNIGVANVFVTERSDVRLIDGCDDDCLEGSVRLLVCLEFIKLILVPTSDVCYLQTSRAGGYRGVLARVYWRIKRFRGLSVVDCRFDREEQQSQPAVAAMGINRRRVCVQF